MALEVLIVRDREADRLEDRENIGSMILIAEARSPDEVEQKEY